MSKYLIFYLIISKQKKSVAWKRSLSSSLPRSSFKSWFGPGGAITPFAVAHRSCLGAAQCGAPSTFWSCDRQVVLGVGADAGLVGEAGRQWRCSAWSVGLRLLCPRQARDADPWENGRCGAGSSEGWARRPAREQRGEVDQRVPGRQPGRAQAEDVGRRWSRYSPS